MTEAIIILLNMRGGCATVGDKVHALFRVTSRGKRQRTHAAPDASDDSQLSCTSAATLKNLT
jgi:hypothetical protein